MEMNFSPKDILDVWNSYSGLHADMTVRTNYYEGNHKFLSNERNSDGSSKNSVPVNFCSYIVDSHTAASTKIPFQYTAEDESNPALTNLDEVIEANDLHTIDTKHFRTSLTCGYSVEVHSFEDDQIKISQYDPREWAFIYDTDRKIQLAIHKAVIKPFTIFRDTYIKKETVLYTVYDSLMKREFLQDAGKKELSLLTEVEHMYGQVPIVLFSVTESNTPFLSNNIINQNNIYSKIANIRVDELEYNIDSFLLITGMDPNQPDVEQRIAQFKKNRFVILPDAHSSFSFVTKGSETEKYKQALEDSRESIHTQGYVPDIRNIFGDSSAVSGMALKYKFQPMMQRAGSFSLYIKQAVRDRIDLINRIWSIQRKPLLLDFDINIQFYLPIDVLAERASLKDLKDILSLKRLLEISQDVDDPEAEYERILEEKGLLAPTSPSPGVPGTQATQTPKARPEALPEPQRLAKSEKAITAGSKKAGQRIVDDYMKNLPEAVVQQLLQSGDLQKFLAKYKAN